MKLSGDKLLAWQVLRMRYGTAQQHSTCEHDCSSMYDAFKI